MLEYFQGFIVLSQRGETLSLIEHGLFIIWVNQSDPIEYIGCIRVVLLNFVQESQIVQHILVWLDQTRVLSMEQGRLDFIETFINDT